MSASPSVAPRAGHAPEVPATGEPTRLEVQRLTVRFADRVALEDVSLVVAGGAWVALVGESGAGKSTLLRCFNRLVVLPSTDGRVLVDGLDVRTVDAVMLRRRIGYVPQDGGLLPHWRVERNVALVPLLCGEPRAQAIGQAHAALRLVGLDPAEFGHRLPSELSGGQRQRVAMARALAHRPQLLLLDEPFGALDAITRAELQDSLLRLRRAIRSTVLLVTHDLHEALLLADRVAVMRAGRLEQMADGEMLLTHPATPYVRELLARARVTEHEVRELSRQREATLE